MPVRHKAAAFAGIEIDGPQPIEKRNQFRAGARGAAAGDHKHAPRGPEEVDRFRNLRRIRTRHRVRLGAEMFLELQGLWHDAAQRIGRKVDERWSWLPAFAEGACDSLVKLLQHQRWLAHRARITRDRSDQLRVIHVLQAAAVFLRARIAARQHQDGCARDMCVGDTRDRVGHAGTGCDHRDPKFAREFSMRLRHVNCGTFVANVDDLNPFGVQPHPDRHDMAAA
jgi:hypothetical protein